MAMIQKDARRFFSYLFLSQSSLVLVGLESASHVGLTGGLCVWASVVLALGGLGLTLRAVESRFGHFSLTSYRGLYEHVPLLAVCFLLTGLGSVGFPGTIGFVGTEILIDGVVEVYPHIGAAVVIAAAFNGIAIVRAYFLLFTGAKHASSISLNVGLAERTAVLTLAILILGGGFLPQPGIAMSSNAATEIISARPAILAPEDPQKSSDDDEQHSEHEHHTEILEKQSH
jgi:NADH-quinone oxidoreductase subunit M